MFPLENPMQDILYLFYQPCTDCIYHDRGQHLDSECNGIMNQILEELIWICGDFLRDIGQSIWCSGSKGMIVRD